MNANRSRCFRPGVCSFAIALTALFAKAAPAAWALQESKGDSPPQRIESLTATVTELLAQGRAADAEDALRDELANQRSPSLLVELGAVLVERAGALEATSDLGKSLRRGVLEDALATYLEASADPLETVAATIGAATCHVLLERDAEAEATITGALARLREHGAPVTVRRRLASELVHFLATRERAEQARRVAKEAAALGELDPGQQQIEELRILAAQHASAEALTRSIAAVDAGADGFEVAFLAWEAFGDAQLEAKLHLYSRLIERQPGDLAFTYYRGVTRFLLNDGPGAVKDLERCIAGDPRFGNRARSFLGRALIRSNRAEEALPHFEKLLAERGELISEALDGVIGVAVARARTRQYATALELYEEVVARDPHNLWGHIGRPLCFRYLGQLDRSAQAYEEGLLQLPDEPQLLNDYALLLHARGERERARELFERALGAGSPDGGENLGIFALRDDQDAVTAARFFARTLLLDGARPRIRFYRELCLCEQ